MENINKVFIARSLDGYIADRKGGLDWLHAIPNPEGTDAGYAAFMRNIDAILMGRNTFEAVCGFDIPWPFQVPVFVLSNSLNSVPEKATGRAELVKGSLSVVLSQINERGHHHLYIDGGVTIQQLLQLDLIDELIVTTLPVLLGAGVPLFGYLEQPLEFEHVRTEVFLGQMVQSCYRRKRTHSPNLQ